MTSPVLSSCSRRFLWASICSLWKPTSILQYRNPYIYFKKLKDKQTWPIISWKPHLPARSHLPLPASSAPALNSWNPQTCNKRDNLWEIVSHKNPALAMYAMYIIINSNSSSSQMPVLPVHFKIKHLTWLLLCPASVSGKLGLKYKQTKIIINKISLFKEI